MVERALEVRPDVEVVPEQVAGLLKQVPEVEQPLARLLLFVRFDVASQPVDQLDGRVVGKAAQQDGLAFPKRLRAGLDVGQRSLVPVVLAAFPDRARLDLPKNIRRPRLLGQVLDHAHFVTEALDVGQGLVS